MAVTYNEFNSIYDGGDFWDSTFVSGAITVTNDGVVLNINGGLNPSDALNLDDFIYTVTVNGVVGTLVPEGDGIELEATGITGLSKINVGLTGTVFGDYGIDANHAATITNKGRIEGFSAAILHQGDGTYTIANSGEIIAALNAIEIDGLGTHTITNSSAGEITGGGYAIFAWDGWGSIEKVTNQGYIFSEIYLGDGNDTLSNSGVIVADFVNLGSGNDTFTNTGRLYTDTGGFTLIDLGDGADKFTGSTFTDYVVDNFGADTIGFGGGNDFFWATYSNDGFTTDTLDGSTNLVVNLRTFANGIGDEYYAGDAFSDVYINLDTAQRYDDIFDVTLAASSASGADVGFDIVKNFEAVITGEGNDLVFGNATANYIETGLGDDNLYGLAGRDYLWGGDGEDDLFGGAGGDTLYGGGFDGFTDRFNYSALSDSTVGILGRDTIYDFVDSEDMIDFSRLNLVANMLIVDNNFTGTSGFADIRVLTSGSGWIIQLDRDGNRKADMAIEVADLSHSITWDVGDFIV